MARQVLWHCDYQVGLFICLLILYVNVSSNVSIIIIIYYRFDTLHVEPLAHVGPISTRLDRETMLSVHCAAYSGVSGAFLKLI